MATYKQANNMQCVIIMTAQSLEKFAGSKTKLSLAVVNSELIA